MTRKNKKIIFYSLLFTVLMFGFGYALVPLYNILCKSLGVNGKTNNIAANTSASLDNTRTVVVEFLATNNANLPWDFYPETKKIEIHPGENARLAYYAKNNSNQTMTVQAVPSVSPGLAAAHLKKTECFCFRQQTLNAHQSKDMPLIFHLDNELPKNIHEITLSYTLFATPNSISK